MKRKERKLVLRIVNGISSIVLVCSCMYFFFLGFSIVAIMSTIMALCCVGGPVVMEGGGFLEILLDSAIALFHGAVDAVIGIFEAISNIFSGIG